MHATNLWKLLPNWLRINELGGRSESSSPMTPSTPTTPINLDSDDTPIFEVGGIVPPMGRKAAKKKVKAQAPDLVLRC